MTGAPDEWRRVKRYRSRLVWVYWAVMFYEALVLTSTLKNHPLIGLLLAFPAAYVTLALATLGVQLVVWLGATRFWPPSDIPPPPQDDPAAENTTAYLQQPKFIYPVIAQAKGQCGWVKIGLRVDRLGRIESFQVIEQAPNCVFERTVANALFEARLSPDPVADPLREMTSVIVFLVPCKTAPDWVQERSVATT